MEVQEARGFTGHLTGFVTSLQWVVRLPAIRAHSLVCSLPSLGDFSLCTPPTSLHPFAPLHYQLLSLFGSLYSKPPRRVPFSLHPTGSGFFPYSARMSSLVHMAGLACLILAVAYRISHLPGLHPPHLC